MHFHLPKPIHGWREFLGEVGIIVLGVMVALALDAVAEDLSWHRKVSEARQVIRYEVGHNIRLMQVNEQQSKCAGKRLDQLGAVLNIAIKTGRLPPLGRFAGPSGGTWPDGVWQSQISAETATHFPERELASLARVYRYIQLVRERQTKADEAWTILKSMSGPGRQVDAGTIDRLAYALEVARDSAVGVQRAHNYINDILKQSSLGSDFPQIDPKNPPVGTSGTPPVCQPISNQIPGAYGQV